MAKYIEFKLKIRSDSEKVPDFGLGKGVLITQRARLNDDEQVGAIQMINMENRLIEENIEVIAVPITKYKYYKND